MPPEFAADCAAFLHLVRARLDRGWEEYGNRSFERQPIDLTSEIKEELADICGWSAILYTRICQLERKIKGEL